MTFNNIVIFLIGGGGGDPYDIKKFRSVYLITLPLPGTLIQIF